MRMNRIADLLTLKKEKDKLHKPSALLSSEQNETLFEIRVPVVNTVNSLSEALSDSSMSSISESRKKLTWSSALKSWGAEDNPDAVYSRLSESLHLVSLTELEDFSGVAYPTPESDMTSLALVDIQNKIIEQLEAQLEMYSRLVKYSLSF